MAYLFKRRQRKIGKWNYRILRVYQPQNDEYKFRLERQENSMFHKLWEFVYQTESAAMADGWSDEMGLTINNNPDRIRKPLI